MPFVHHLRRPLLLFLLGIAASGWAQISPTPSTAEATSANPYNLQLRANEAELRSATPAQASVLLERIQGLRDFVDDPSAITNLLRRTTDDTHQHAVIRAQARWYLAHDTATPAEGQWSNPSVIRLAREAVDADPYSASAHEILGETERMQGWPRYADEFERAAQLQPTAKRWIEVARNCSIANCRFTALQRALHISPQDGQANSALAAYYVERHQLEKALHLLTTAASSSPADYVLAKQYADLKLALGDRAAAFSDYRRLEAQFPAPLWLRRELGLKYAELGFFADATRLLEPLLSGGDDDRVYAALKHVYQQTENAGGLKALEEWKLARNPANSEAAGTLAKLSSEQGNGAEAIRSMQELEAKNPGEASLHESLSYLYGSTGHEKRYEQELAKVAELEGGSENLRRQFEFAGLRPAIHDPDRPYLANTDRLALESWRHPPSDAANVISLANTTVERVSSNGLSSQHTQLVLFINSAAGALDYSTYRIQYSHALQKLDVINACIHKSNGSVVAAQTNGETGYADAAVSMYYDTRQRIVSFPHLAKGDVLELEYRISPKTEVNPYGNYFGGLITFQSNLPEKLRRYVLIAPASESLNILEERMPSPAMVKSEGALRTYVWEVRNMPPLHTEPRGPSLTETAPYVNVSTFDSWQALGKWYAGFIAPQLELDAQLRTVLDGIVSGKSTELERIRAIHEFVIENTHYVGLEFGVYSYKPYPVSEVYARRFGDCKDKASLMIALMRAAGIDAQFALVRTRKLGDVAGDATSLQIFDHAIVYIPKYNLWLDGTAEYSGSRELPLDDQGAMALTVAANGDAVMRRIPITLPMENYTHRVVHASLKADGTIEFTGSAYTRGEDAPGLRREFEATDRQRDSLRANLAQVYPAVRVEDVHVNGAADVEHDVNLQFKGSIDTFTGSHSVTLVSSWMPHKYTETLASLPSRAQDLRLPAPWTTEEELHFELPAGASFESIPRSTTLDTPFGVAVLQYEHRGRELVVSTSVQFRKLRISPAEYPNFRAFCEQVEKAFHTEIQVRLAG
ncbi:MAG TPA: DUF3857 domain-containing protein [Terriglobales bacterium]|nr:DUF3857 domain-containing protein [Terriglobales bacterium]